MRLSQLLGGVTVQAVIGADPQSLDAMEVGEVRDDSRKVQPGDVFVAVAGQTVDGHRFLADALARGAALALVERPDPQAALPQLQVASTAEALAELAANQAGRPADALTLVAVTGTNGKSTTTYLVEAMLQHAGLRTGLLGTVQYRYEGKSVPAPFTTPPPLVLHQALREMREAGVQAAVMEASSHGLQLGRLGAVRFRVAAFTNLTQDHLDLHGDMEGYFQAKALLFRRHLLPAAEGGVAVINIDAEHGPRMAQVAREGGARLLTVSTRGEADVSLLQAQLSLQGTTCVFRTPAGEVELRSPLIGHHNLENLAIGVGIGVALGLETRAIGAGLSSLGGVPGRLERVPSTHGSPMVFVDYAHTPDALVRVVAALRSCPPGLGDAAGAGADGGERRGRLLVVFGCGGDRDRDKRPKMGLAAAQGADLVIVTTDNPRTEAPAAIAEMVLSGIAQASPPSPLLPREELAAARRGHLVELDRRQAILTAVLAARPEDVVLVAGKGHEDYQIIGATRHPFDDRLVAAEALERWAEGPRDRALEPPPSIELPVERVLAATSGQLVRGAPRRFSSVVIDGRKACPGALYVAIRGEKHDGHAFVGQAVAAGAGGALVERGRGAELQGLHPDTAVIEVGDTTVALGQLARAHRQAPEIARGLQIVAVTGSTGKTSTKDLIAAILEAHAPGEVLRTEGNLNNHFGVPLTLLRLRTGLRYAVIEMGMSARGEIAYLASLAQPDVGVLTNVGPVHLESLGTVENVARAKGELFTALEDGAAAVYPAGPGHELAAGQATLAGAGSGRLRAFPASAGEATADAPTPSVHADVLAEGAEGLRLRLRALPPGAEAAPAELMVTVPLVGAHQAQNAALAAACALSLDVPLATIAEGLPRVHRGKHRGQVLEVAGRHVLDDCYNASPPSTRAAIRSLAALKGAGRALVIFGDMLELGPTGPALHAEIGEFAVGKADLLVAVGPLAAAAAAAAAERGLEAVTAASPEEAAEVLADRSRPGDWILIKASRGMRLERALERLPELLAQRQG